MADIPSITPATRCFSCLTSYNNEHLQLFKIQNDSLKKILQTEHLILCYICKKVAKNTETFIHNVQTSQTILRQVQNETEHNLENLRSSFRNLFNLTTSSLDNCQIIEITGLDPQDDEKIKMEFENGIMPTGKEIDFIKQEPSYQFVNEDSATDDNFDIFMNSLDSEYAVKVEGSLLKLPKREMQRKKTTVKRERKVGNSNSDKIRKIKKKQGNSKSDKIKKIGKFKRKGIDFNELPITGDMDTKIETVFLTNEQYLEERAQKQSDKSYKDSIYKCENCIKGFTHKPSYEKHMEKHSVVSGDFECEICKLRVTTEDKLTKHNRTHTVRYRCVECGIARICRTSILDHISTVHEQGILFRCPKCNKGFKRNTSLRKHMYYSHKEKIECVFCKKHYASKETLKAHVTRRHPSEVSGRRPVCRHVCSVCGAAFVSPSALNKHVATHSDKRDYYCVECDKSFKTYAILQQHLKTVSVHVTQEDLKFPCPLCAKRFTTKGHADRHINDVHIKTALYYCDQCGKEFRCKYKLAYHLKAHDGYDKPRKFVCSICFKGFHLKRVLEGHVRIHTGEKPFHCPECPASFNQYGSLYNHKKLVHKLAGKRTDKQTNALDQPTKVNVKTKVGDLS